MCTLILCRNITESNVMLSLVRASTFHCVQNDCIPSELMLTYISAINSDNCISESSALVDTLSQWVMHVHYMNKIVIRKIIIVLKSKVLYFSILYLFCSNVATKYSSKCRSWKRLEFFVSSNFDYILSRAPLKSSNQEKRAKNSPLAWR